VLLLVLAGVLAACTGAEEEPSATASEDSGTSEGGGAVAPSSEGGTEASGASLAGVCPDPVVIQLDWEPEAEHGGIYELVGEGYEIDTNAKKVVGPLMASGADTGVDIEIRIGGSPIGFQPAEALLYQDQNILLGFGRVAEMTATYADLPTTAVMTTFEKSPYAIYWDPETYPDAQTIADLSEDNVTILAGSGSDVWKNWLVDEGIVTEGQLDSSDQEKPAAFIAAGGEVAEAGFATAEPFLYEHEVADQWGKPVRLQLIHDSGFPEYFQAVNVRAEDVEGQAECLEQLVPILQQASVDFVADPGPTNELIVELVEAYDTGWIYTPEAAQFAAEQMVELGIVGDGNNDTIGDFEEPRVQELIDIVGQVTDADVSGLTAEDLATNQFIDQSIGLP
jgi:hypothetical protein